MVHLVIKTFLLVWSKKSK